MYNKHSTQGQRCFTFCRSWSLVAGSERSASVWIFILTMVMDSVRAEQPNIKWPKHKDKLLNYQKDIVTFNIFLPPSYQKGFVVLQSWSIQKWSGVSAAQKLTPLALLGNPVCQFLKELLLLSDHFHPTRYRPNHTAGDALSDVMAEFCWAFSTIARSVWYVLQYVWAFIHVAALLITVYVLWPVE